MIAWTGFAPWELEFPLPGSLTSTFQATKAKYGGGRAPSVSMSLDKSGQKDDAEGKKDTPCKDKPPDKKVCATHQHG